MQMLKNRKKAPHVILAHPTQLSLHRVYTNTDIFGGIVRLFKRIRRIQKCIQRSNKKVKKVALNLVYTAHTQLTMWCDVRYTPPFDVLCCVGNTTMFSCPTMSDAVFQGFSPLLHTLLSYMLSDTVYD